MCFGAHCGDCILTEPRQKYIPDNRAHVLTALSVVSVHIVPRQPTLQFSAEILKSGARVIPKNWLLEALGRYVFQSNHSCYEGPCPIRCAWQYDMSRSEVFFSF
jgi:hypothetical protein